MPAPLTDMAKVFAMRPQIQPFFKDQGDLLGFQLFPTTPHPRAMVNRGLEKPTVYPMWTDIDEVMAQKGTDYSQFEGVIILGGIGLGYLAEAIAAKLGHFATLAIWEPDGEWLRAACYFRDNTPLLTNAQVQLIIGGEDMLRQYVEMMYGQLALNVTTVIDSCLGDMYPARRAMLDDVLAPMIKAQEGNRSTLIAFGEKFFVNAMRSLPALSTSYPVTNLKGTTPKIPAIIVGAGPGLNRHVETLRAAQAMPRTHLVFAADTAIDTLLEHGIVPDFVLSVDPQADTALKYDNLVIPDETALIYHPGSYYTIAQNFTGLKFVCPSMIPPLDLFHVLLPEDRVGNQIQCQVHLGFDVAEMMGCSPIILVGIDLCYYGVDSLYAKNPPQLVGHEQEIFDRAWAAKDMNGTDVFMTSQFDQYRSGFADRARRTRVINANEQGLWIIGTTHGPLSTVIAEECGSHLVDWPRIRQRATNGAFPVHREALLEKLRPVLKEWAFYKESAIAAIDAMKNGIGEPILAAQEAGQDRRTRVCQIMSDLCKRHGSMNTLILLEQFGHVLPRPIRKVRLPALVDRIQYECEWVQTRLYCEWLVSAASLAVAEGEAVEELLADKFTPEGQT